MQAARDVEDICDDTIQTKRESSDVDVDGIGQNYGEATRVWLMGIN